MPSHIDMKKNIVYKTALAAILCALAVALNFLEGLLPEMPFLPPGAKPGLSNIITMFAAYSLGLPQAITITLVKAGFTFITRGVTASLMSLSGGMLSTLVMYFLLRYGKKIFGIIGISVLSSLSHNLGQLLVSVMITGSSKTFYYAPFLAIFGLVSGTLTGIIFRAVIPALEKQKKNFYKFDN